MNLSFWLVVVFVYLLFNRVCSSGSQICDSQLSAGEKQELRNIVEKLGGNGDGLSPMRAPLQLSLLISSIYSQPTCEEIFQSTNYVFDWHEAWQRKDQLDP